MEHKITMAWFCEDCDMKHERSANRARSGMWAYGLITEEEGKGWAWHTAQKGDISHLCHNYSCCNLVDKQPHFVIESRGTNVQRNM